MSARPSEWDLVKLGDCYRGGKAFFGVQRDASSQSAVDLATGTCISRDQRLADELALETNDPGSSTALNSHNTIRHMDNPFNRYLVGKLLLSAQPCNCWHT